MNTQLALKSKVQPKPTRAEIVDALTQLEVQRRSDQSKADAARKKKLGEELAAEMIAAVVANASAFIGEMSFGYFSDKPYGYEVRFSVDKLASNAALSKRLKEYAALPDRAREYRFTEVRKEILGATRGMLKDKDSRASLEKMLDTLSGK